MRGVVKKEAETGHTGRTIAANIARLRGGLSYTEMSRRLQDSAGWSINAVGIRRIESTERRVTIDDLMAFAVALGVSPVTLLMPESAAGDQKVTVSGVEAEISAQEAWDWLRGNYPLPGDDRLPTVYRAATWPQWRFNEQIQQDRKSNSAWLKARRDQKKYQELDLDGDD